MSPDDNSCPVASCYEAERLDVDGLSHDALMRQTGSEEEREHYGRRMAAQETAGLLRQVGEHERARQVAIKIAGRAALTSK